MPYIKGKTASLGSLCHGPTKVLIENIEILIQYGFSTFTLSKDGL